MLGDNEWEMVAKYVCKECSESEKGEIEDSTLLMEHAKIFRAYLNELFPVERKHGSWDVETALRIVHHIGQMPQYNNEAQTSASGRGEVVTPSTTPNIFVKIIRLKSLTKIAAVIVMLIGISYVAVNLRTFSSKKTFGENIVSISTGRGEQKKLLLDDGTEVTLNSETTIKLSSPYGRKNREVELVGEAFFAVAHHGQPLIVHTQNAIIEDLGTEFCVEAWQGEDETEVVVQSGRVTLKNRISSKEDEVVVTRGEMSAVNAEGVLLHPVRANLSLKLGWMGGSLIFDRTSLSHVITNLERNYPRTFIVSDSSLLARKLTATYMEKPFDEILNAITLSLNMQYEVKGDTIFLKTMTQGVLMKANKQKD